MGTCTFVLFPLPREGKPLGRHFSTSRGFIKKVKDFFHGQMGTGQEGMILIQKRRDLD